MVPSEIKHTPPTLYMDLPNFQTFLRPVLEVLSDGAPHSRQDIIRKVLDRFHFSEEELAVTHKQGGGKVLDGRVSWALVYLKHADLINSPSRAMYNISKTGYKSLQSNVEINIKYLYSIDAFRQFMMNCKGATETTTNQAATFEDEREDPFAKINEACTALRMELKDELLSALLSLRESEFERFCVDLLVKMGYGNPNLSRVTQATADGGIDGVVTSDRLGFDKIFVQAKLYSLENPISEAIMRNFVGALDQQESSARGVFITTSKFTKGAAAKANGSKHHKIMLIDGDRLTELMIEFGVGVVTTNTFTIKAIDSSFYEQYEQR